MALKPAASVAGAYHTLSIQGLPGSGKNYLAALAPKKQAIISSDGGWRRAIFKSAAPWSVDQFVTADHVMISDLSADKLFKAGDRDESEKAAHEQAERVLSTIWKPMFRDAQSAFQDDSVKSVVYDLMDDIKQTLRLAYLGKLEKNPQMNYGPVNEEMKNLIRLPLKHRKTAIFIHKVKQKYIKGADNKSVEVPGVFHRKPDDNTDYAIESFVQCFAVQPGQTSPKGPAAVEMEWWVQVLNAKKNPMANGAIFPQPETWAELMQYLDPDTPAEAWGE
jgi:hypothetical protein